MASGFMKNLKKGWILDNASLAGIICGLTLIVVSILIGGDLGSFVNLPGLMIVVGGTLAAILITFQFDDVKAAFKAAIFVFTSRKTDSNEISPSRIILHPLESNFTL